MRGEAARRRTAGATLRSLVGVPLVVGAFLLAACGDVGGSDDPSSSASPTESTTPPGTERGELSGVVREPAPVVSGTSLPSLTDPGSEVGFAASAGHLKAVYFGFTNCPDVCPTTLADLTVALRKLDRASQRADRIETLMVTVDPDRDLEILPGYVTSFISNAVAAGSPDAELLAAAAEPFGVGYDVRTLDDGTIEVDHSPFLYVVDDQGRLVLSWQFGTSSDDMASDLGLLLDRYEP